MARKNKNIASFNDVANINNDSNEKKINTKNHTTKYLDQLLEGKQKNKKQTKVTGIYLDNDIENILNQLAQKGGKGTKSKIVNEALRLIFNQKGLL